MRHFYDASHFFSQLRPFLKCGNIAENGIVFELPNELNEYSIRLNNGSTRLIRSHEVIFGIRGPSGAGTTSLSSIDAGLQITTSIHSNPHLEITMKEFRQFHPALHYQFHEEFTSITFT
jgi:hypothetical protein